MKKLCTMLACLVGLTMCANAAIAEEAQRDLPPGPPPNSKFNQKPSKHVDLDSKLKLTDEQKEKARKNHMESREKLKPIMEQMRANHQKMDEIKKSNLSESEKAAKFAEVKKDMKELRKQANVIREEDMKNFESILTDKQKKKFEKIKEERKKEMEKRRKEMKQGQRPPRPEFGK